MVILYITLKFGAEWYIGSKLTEKINKDNQLFQVNVENTRVNVFSREVNLYDIVFTPVDSNSSSIEGTLQSLSLGSFDISNFLFNEIIESEAIILKQPKLNVNLKKSDNKEKEKNKSSKGLFSQNIFEKIKVHRILLQEANVDFSGSLNSNLQLRSFSLQNIVVDSASMAGKVPFNYDSVIVKIDSLSLQPDSQYKLSTGKINLAQHQLEIDEFSFDPQFTKSEYSSRFPERKPMYDVYIKKIIFDSLYWQLPGGHPMNFTVGNIDMDSLNLQMYIDKNVPRNADKIRPMPSKALADASFLLNINSINTTNSKFLYQIQPKDAANTGDLFFTNLKMNATNITNDSSILADNPEARFDFDAKFMGAGNLKAVFTFNLASNDYPFSASGNLAPVNFAALDPLIGPLMSLEANGNLNNLTYNFSGNQESAGGTVDMAYQNMQLIFKEKPGESAPILKALSSLVLENNLKRDNSSNADVSFNKEDTRSFFYYWWSGIRGGIKDIVLPL